MVGRFYEDLAERLVSSAMRVFVEAGAEGVDVFDVPGAYELPFAAQEVARTGRYAGVACLGAVIRGETPHFDYVCDAVTRGIGDAVRTYKIPIGFGVLTTDDVQQAMARAGMKDANKGYEALLTAVEMIHVMRSIS